MVFPLVAALAVGMAVQSPPAWRDTPSGAVLEAQGRPVIELSCSVGRLGMRASALPRIVAGRDVLVLVGQRSEKASGIAGDDFMAAFSPSPDWFEALGKADRLTLRSTTSRRRSHRRDRKRRGGWRVCAPCRRGRGQPSGG